MYIYADISWTKLPHCLLSNFLKKVPLTLFNVSKENHHVLCCVNGDQFDTKVTLYDDSHNYVHVFNVHMSVNIANVWKHEVCHLPLPMVPTFPRSGSCTSG